MFYRILSAPPGYPPHQQYMVAAYRTLEFQSSIGYVKNSDGSKYFGSLEEARMALPSDAEQLPFQPEPSDFFLELWESSHPGG
jgi:hypothetical protein